MNVIRPEKIEGAETEVDGNFAAASEVEAGIRDFVRNDVAYLRRPGNAGATEPPPVPAPAPVVFVPEREPGSASEPLLVPTALSASSSSSS